MKKEEKNLKIKTNIKDTISRHSKMTCKTFGVKVVSNKLNNLQKEQINQLFKEAKWFRNAYITNNEINAKAKTVLVKVGKNFEERKLELLGSQIKQSIIKEVETERKALFTKKKKGMKVGKLKCKPFCNAIELKQFGKTYRIKNDYINVQNIKKGIRIKGLKQIPEEVDICNAKFVRRASGLYFYITCYVPKRKEESKHQSIGIDFGIKNNLTLSNGEKFNICVKESKATKILSTKINKALIKNGRTKSKNHYKRVSKLRRSYEKENRKKRDLVNKIVSYILSYDFIAIQDEMIHNWQSSVFGKEIQHSNIGLIKAKLRKNSKVYIVDKSFPSTQICPVCGKLNKHTLKDRNYCCKYCGYYHKNRDEKAAQSILDYAISSMERRSRSLVENTSSTTNMSLDSKKTSMKQEAHYLGSSHKIFEGRKIMTYQNLENVPATKSQIRNVIDELNLLEAAL